MREIERVGEAVAHPTRRRILIDLYADPTPRTVDEVAAAAGVHRTVAFGHLERLARLGYVASERRRGRRGKPAKVYRPSAPVVSVSHPERRFEELAVALAQAFARLSPVAGGAREAGRSLAPVVRGQGIDAALRALEPLGAGYRLSDFEVITATNCVFREVCGAAPDVVCDVQAGLLEGTLSAAGVACNVQPQGPLPEGGCSYRLLNGGSRWSS